MSIFPKTTRLPYEIADKIVAYLAKLSLQTGDKIPSEHDWMKMTNASRSSVREALHILVGMGWLEVFPGRGYFLRKPMLSMQSEPILLEGRHHPDFNELTEARQIIECAAASLAAVRGNLGQFDQLERFLDETKEVAEAGKAIYTNLCEFHRRIVELSNNKYLIEVMDNIILPQLLDPGQEVERGLPGRGLIDLIVHYDLLKVIRQKNPGSAAEAMRRHILHADEIYKLTLAKALKIEDRL